MKQLPSTAVYIVFLPLKIEAVPPKLLLSLCLKYVMTQERETLITKVVRTSFRTNPLAVYIVPSKYCICASHQDTGEQLRKAKFNCCGYWNSESHTKLS
jgi:hypothetical protein